MLRLLLTESEDAGLLIGDELLPLKEIINQQRALLSMAYLKLRWHNYLGREALSQFGKMEAILVESLDKLNVL